MCGGGGGIGSVVSGIGSAIGGAVKGVVSAVSTVAKNPIFQAIAPVALNYFLPGIGTAATGALGLSASWAPALGGALTGGVMGAIGGGGVGGALKGAALGGVASGAADYLANGNNPLSGMFSGQEGGNVNNALTAGGSGSTQLTGSGSGLGTDKSTLGTQFGVNPSSTGGSGGINFSQNGAVGGLNAPTGAAGLGGSGSGPTSFLGSLADKAKSLIPDSTLGKVALGGGALMALNGMGGKAPQAAPPSTPPGQDPSMSSHLQQLTMNYNPQSPASQYGGDLTSYAQSGAGASAGAGGLELDPTTGRLVPKGVASNQTGSEFKFVNPNYTKQAASGGSIPQYAMGGLSQYASGGMPDVPTDHGYLQGPGDGVSDDIPAMIGDKQPARLAGGEFVIPARIVSELGNGSSDAGAQRLHQMMDRVNRKRLSAKDFAKDTKAYKELPA